MVDESESPRILSIRGFEVTDIAFLDRGFEFPKPLHELDDTLIRSTLDECSTRATKYTSDDELKQALACTLTAGAQRKGKENHAACDHFFGADLEMYLAHGIRHQDAEKFCSAILMIKTFFTTTDGYMGIGSRKMQIGDKICVLFGGEVLFILRPFRERYLLIGECYVHGLMHGEAMEKLKSGEAKEQFFDLV